MILNTNIKSGENTFYKLPSLIKDSGFNNPFIIVDKNLYDNSLYVKKVTDAVSPEKKLMFYDYQFEPSYQMLDKMMERIKSRNIINKVDVIIGIGGGSAMDTSKGLAVLFTNDGPSINFKGFPENINKPLPVIAVPSTTGTGSEVVFNASFIDEDSKVKMGINYKNNYPVLAILDPLIPSTAPINVFASSGCDALVHALESFMSRETNEQVQFFSKRAYSLIMSNMPLILKGDSDLQNWQNMQWAAVYAMFALSNSTSGPSGALSYYLGSHFKVNHGVAGGVFIGKICKYNHLNGYHDLSKFYEGQDQNKIDKEKKSSLVVEQIEQLLDMANMPHNFSEFGVKKEDLEGFNEFSVQVKASFDLNPVEIDPRQVSDLFIKI